jgi:hypothetical protein
MKTIKALTILSFVFGFVLFIQACGGGGGGSSTSGDTYQLGADGLCYDETQQTVAPNYTYCSALSTYNSGIFYISNGQCIDDISNTVVNALYCSSNPFVWQSATVCRDSNASRILPNIYCLPPHSPVYLNAGVCYYTATQTVDPNPNDCTSVQSPLPSTCYGSDYYSFSITYQDGAYFPQWTPVSCPGLGSYCSGETLYEGYGTFTPILCQ